MSPASVAPAVGPALLGESVVVTQRFLDRFAMADDASHYLLIPDAVLTPSNVDDVASIFRAATAAGRPITFRSGGTSLSGQGVTGSILVDTRARFSKVTVEEDGRRVRVEPGVTVRKTNAHLARFRRKLGPDPASEIACTIGGIVANNSRGMACRVDQNTYRTLEVTHKHAGLRPVHTDVLRLVVEVVRPRSVSRKVLPDEPGCRIRARERAS